MEEIKRIPLEGSSNTRDLGGFPTKEGHTIKPCRLIRSCSLAGITESDKQFLTDICQLKTIVDFRSLKETNEKPDPKLPGVSYYSVPVIEDVAAGITHDKESESNSFQNTIGLLQKHHIDAVEYMTGMYQDIASSSFSRNAYRRFFEILLSQKEGAVLWHCSAGKDRAGMGTALVLYALGVEWELIVRDYLMTGTFLNEELKAMETRIQASEGHLNLLPLVQACMGVHEKYIKSVFDIFEKDFGSIDRFLEQGLGLTAKNREELKTLYLA